MARGPSKPRLRSVVSRSRILSSRAGLGLAIAGPGWRQVADPAQNRKPARTPAQSRWSRSDSEPCGGAPSRHRGRGAPAGGYSTGWTRGARGRSAGRRGPPPIRSAHPRSSPAPWCPGDNAARQEPYIGWAQPEPTRLPVNMAPKTRDRPCGEGTSIRRFRWVQSAHRLPSRKEGVVLDERKGLPLSVDQEACPDGSSTGCTLTPGLASSRTPVCVFVRRSRSLTFPNLGMSAPEIFPAFSSLRPYAAQPWIVAQ